MIEWLPTIATWLVWGVAGMFFTLAGIMAVGCVIYPLYPLFDGIRKNLL